VFKFLSSNKTRFHILDKIYCYGVSDSDYWMQLKVKPECNALTHVFRYGYWPWPSTSPGLRKNGSHF